MARRAHGNKRHLYKLCHNAAALAAVAPERSTATIALKREGTTPHARAYMPLRELLPPVLEWTDSPVGFWHSGWSFVSL